MPQYLTLVFYVPLHKVIHEDIGSDAVEPHVPPFFRGDVVFLYRRDELLLEGGVYILI